MKKKSTILCLLALVFGAGMMLSSCKDNENVSDVNPDEEVLEKGSEKGEALLSILSMAAELDSLPNDWYKNTYTVEPTIGTVKDEANPYVRYIAVSDSADAYTVYKSMVSEDLTGTVKDETWIKDGIGSLAFKVVKNQADLIATVDVNVQQMPHLKQICFVPASALPDNSGWFSGDPYYQFGDVVKDTGDDTYWFCARPANKAAGKSTTHWVSFNIPDTNFKEYEKAGYAKLTLPDALGNKAKSEEHILNFMKLLYAVNNGSENDLKLSGVKLPKEDIKAIFEVWKENEIWGEQQYFSNIGIKYMPNLFSGYNVNVFYYGHCSGNTPDVHMLTTQAPNFGLDKKEIKFEWPKADEKKDYNFKNYLNPEGNTADLASLNCKKDNKIPESAIIMRYKTGPQLSGESTLFGNDKYPGQSFKTYTKGKIEDVSVFSQLDNDLDRYYRMGDIVKKNNDNEEENNDKKAEFLCIKSSSPYYFKKNMINEEVIFINANYNEDNKETEDDNNEAAIIAFHMLNAYLLNTGAIKFESYKNYQQSLKDIWNFIDNHTEFKSAFSYEKTDEGDKYDIKLHFVNKKYLLRYNTSDKKYNLTISNSKNEENEQDKTYLKLNVKYSFELNNTDYKITQKSSADIKKSANEAAKLFNSAEMTVNDNSGE